MNSAEHVFTCAGRPQLRVDLTKGTLFIRGWDGNDIRVSDAGAAEIRQKGDKIILESSSRCDLKVYVPRASDIYVDATNLELDMGGIQGFGSIDVTDGLINIGDWQGDLELDGTGSEIRLSRCNGQVGIDTAGGGVEIISSQGRFAIDTGAGSVTVQDSSGSLDADTGGGSVFLRQFKGPVHIDTGNGNVELQNITGRNVFVDCGGGNIEASLPGTSPGRWQLDTGSGAVVLHVPENISARFEFEGPDLDIGDLALERSSQEGDRVTGILNQGQGSVTVFSSTGRITGRMAPAAFTISTEPEPSQDEESLKILTMLENGSITTAEAEELLEALRGGVDDDE